MYFYDGHRSVSYAKTWRKNLCNSHLASLVLVTTSSTIVCWLVCLTSQQHASVSQGRICSDNFTCCHTEIQVADQTFYLTQSQHTDTGPTSPSAAPITPGAWQGSHWSANFLSFWYDSTPKKIPPQAGFEPGIFHSRGGRLSLTTRPTRRSTSLKRMSLVRTQLRATM